MSWTSASILSEPLAPRASMGRVAAPLLEQSGPQGVVDVVVDVSDPVDDPHDPALERLGQRRPRECRTIPSRTCSVRLSPRRPLELSTTRKECS